MAVRNRRKGGFTTIQNEVLLNAELSLKAKGLLIIMLSRPDDWVYHLSWVEKQSSDGKIATRGALKELLDAGYVVREKAKGQDGKFTGWDYIVGDTPTGMFHDGRETRRSENTTVVKPEATNTDSTKTDFNKTEETSVSTDAPITAELVESPRGAPDNLAGYYLAWNDNCGALPKSRNNKQANKLLKRELKDRAPGELEHAIRCGARAVAGDSYWQQQGYGLVSLLRNLDSKAEKYENNGGLSGGNAKAYGRAHKLLDLRLGAD